MSEPINAHRRRLRFPSLPQGAESIIAETVRFDHRPSENARRIVDALTEHGYRITAQSVSSLPEITRTYGEPVGQTTSDGTW